ncbi:MAG: ECF-type sigma factor [Planctomycetota bacterium]
MRRAFVVDVRNWNSRSHFFRDAIEAMRRILIAVYHQIRLFYPHRSLSKMF